MLGDRFLFVQNPEGGLEEVLLGAFRFGGKSKGGWRGYLWGRFVFVQNPGGGGLEGVLWEVRFCA